MSDSVEFPETAVDGRFAFATSPMGRILVSAAAEPLARHAFSTRELEFRDPSASENYRRVANYFRVYPEQVLAVRQVHGRVVLEVRPGQTWSPLSEADAIVSFDPGRVILVRTADCVPILIADRRSRAVGAVHAGWRGTAAGVANAAVEALGNAGVPAKDLMAAIGPSIGPCCYQVDAKVRDAFGSGQAGRWFSPDGEGRWRLDLARANRDQLVLSGVPAGQIAMCGLCTRDGDQWWSFRRDGPAAGRLVAAIRLTGTASDERADASAH